MTDFIIATVAGIYFSELGSARHLLARNAFHEIAHHFLHTPPRSQRQETEARAIALIAILPRGQLEELVSEADEFSEYAERILHERLEVLSIHGI